MAAAVLFFIFVSSQSVRGEAIYAKKAETITASSIGLMT